MSPPVAVEVVRKDPFGDYTVRFSLELSVWASDPGVAKALTIQFVKKLINEADLGGPDSPYLVFGLAEG